jgi:nucleoside-diphosphate-sugar epimerase
VKNILVIGGGGYVGTYLVDELIKNNYLVTVFDLFIYGNFLENNNNLNIIKGDIRDLQLLRKIIKNFDSVIHLACISNDPSFDLNPQLGKSINFDPFEDLIKICKHEGVKRFIYASSSSVYGVKLEKDVDESSSLEPLTDYSKYKALCEDVLFKYNDKDFTCCVVRPATVCGYSKRQRLDLVVNILPNINIKDMSNAYLFLINQPKQLISGEVFNIGFENYSVNTLSNLVIRNIKHKVLIKHLKSEDNRSYHISSKKIQKKLGFKNHFNIEDAIIELVNIFKKKILIDPLNNEIYFNIKRMKSLGLK